MKEIKFTTVGQLKQALQGIPRDTLIICQVVATDGTAWNMWGSFLPPDKTNLRSIAVLTFGHEELETLPPPTQSTK